MIDNFELIEDLLKFGKDTYYYLQIIRRRKDNPGMLESERRIWSKFVCRKESLGKRKTEITELCKHFNARAYIELNPRSLEKFTILSARKYLDRIFYHDYSSIFAVQNQVALSEETIATKGIISKRRWMLDIDNPEDLEDIKNWMNENNITPEALISTPSGYHQILEAFDYTKLEIKLGSDFKIPGTEIITSIKSTCNTILYCP